MSAESPLTCALCDLPYSPGAVTCDGCEHVLADKPNLKALEAELRSLRLQMVLATVAFAAIFVASAFFFGGTAFIVAGGALAWLIRSWFRAREVGRYVARAKRE